MSDRYFSAAPIGSERAVLEGPEAHHLLHVMRARAGDRLTLFDGSGDEFTAEVVECGRNTVEFAILEQHECDRELPFSLTLAVALPKGDRQKWLVEKATELGVTRLIPLETGRGVAQPGEAALVRMRRTVVEASKQCGRNRLMGLDPPQPWEAFIREPGDSATRLLAHPGLAEMSEVVGQIHQAGAVTIAIGPEGGFTDDEVADALGAGWLAVDLGRRILRVETAAIAFSAMVIGCRA
ncbi:MAG: RsmE family RNA methyltransferase [Planctomycetota bacterium]